VNKNMSTEETSFWDQLRKNVLQGIKVAADRTDEIARVGKLKLDLFNLRRQLSHEYSELGKELIAFLDSVPKDGELGSVKNFLEREAVKRHMFHIASLRERISTVEKQVIDTSAPQEKTSSDSNK
jgi:hypothetical protein